MPKPELRVIATSEALAETPIDPEAIPSLEDASPDYRQALGVLNELKHLRAENDAKIARLLNGLAGAGDVPDSQHASRVAALLGREGDAVDSGPNAAAMQKAYGEACAERRAIAAAIEVQTEEVGRAKAQASILVCDAVADHHKRLVRGVCEALIAAHAASAKYDDFLDQLRERDVQVALLNVTPPSFMGHPKDGASRVAYYLTTCWEAGYLSAEALPEVVRRAARFEAVTAQRQLPVSQAEPKARTPAPNYEDDSWSSPS